MFDLCLYDFYFTTQMALGHLLSTIPTIKKLECKDHQIYSKIMRNIYKKRKSNLNFIRIIKNSSFWLPIYTDIPIVQTFLKILWWRFLAPRSTYFDFVNISIYNLLTHTLHWSVQLRFSVFLSINNFFILKFHFITLLLNYLPNKASSEGSFRYYISISRYA